MPSNKFGTTVTIWAPASRQSNSILHLRSVHLQGTHHCSLHYSRSLSRYCKTRTWSPSAKTHEPAVTLSISSSYGSQWLFASSIEIKNQYLLSRLRQMETQYCGFDKFSYFNIKGFLIVRMPSITCPCCMSSVKRILQPLSRAEAIIWLSQ